MSELELTTTIDCVINNVTVERKIQKIRVCKDDEGKEECRKSVETHAFYYCPKDKIVGCQI